MATNLEALVRSQQLTIAQHEKRIRDLEKLAKTGEQKLAQFIKEWNKLQKTLERANRRLG